MIEIETFNELFLNEKKLNKSLTLKTLAVITNMNYSYLSELNSGRKPTNKELVENLNKFLNNT